MRLIKYLLTVVLIIVASTTFAQYPIPQGLGNNPNTIILNNAIKYKNGFVNGVFPDTATANLTHIKDYPYAQIIANDTVYIRDSTATKWVNRLLSYATVSSVSTKLNVSDTSSMLSPYLTTNAANNTYYLATNPNKYITSADVPQNNSIIELYKTTDRSYTTAFTQNGTIGTTISDTSIYFNSSTAVADTLLWNNPDSSSPFIHNYERWEFSTVVQFDSLANNDAGLIIGNLNTASPSKTFEGFQIKAHPANGSLLYVYFIGYSAQLTNGGSLAYNRGDNILIDVQRNKNVFTINLVNQRTGATYTLSQIIDPSSSNNYKPPIYTSRFAIKLIQGHFELKQMRIVTYDASPDFMFIGNSITEGTYTSNYFKSFVGLFRKQYPNTVMFAGGGSKSSDVVNELPAILKSHPKRAVVMIGTNDLLAGTPIATIMNNIRTIQSTLNNAKINYTFLGLVPRADYDVRPINDSIKASITGTANQYIAPPSQLFKVGSYQDSTAFYYTDNVHPNDSGHVYIATKVLAEIYKVPNGFEATIIPTNLSVDGKLTVGDNYARTANDSTVIISGGLKLLNSTYGANKFLVSGADGGITDRVIQSTDIPNISETQVTNLPTDLNGKLNISDTTAMLTNYAKNSVVALKVNISDTSNMLLPYAKNSALALKLNISDTTAMLLPYRSSFINESFDTTSRALTLTRIDGTTQSVVIPRGTASGVSGIASLSNSRTGDVVTVSGDNGSTTTFSINNADSATRLESTGSYSNPSWLTSLGWSKLTGTPTTLAGYGITDAAPLTNTPALPSGSIPYGNGSAVPQTNPTDLAWYNSSRTLSLGHAGNSGYLTTQDSWFPITIGGGSIVTTNELKIGGWARTINQIKDSLGNNLLSIGGYGTIQKLYWAYLSADTVASHSSNIYNFGNINLMPDRTVQLPTVNDASGDFVTRNSSTGLITRRTASEVLTDIGALTTTAAATTYVPLTRTISGHALSSNITLGESDITNLTTDLAAKATDANVVHLTGNETKTGNLTINTTVPVLTLIASDNVTPFGIAFDNDGFIKQITNTGELQFNVGRNTSWGGKMTFYTDSIKRLDITDAYTTIYNPFNISTVNDAAGDFVTRNSSTGLITRRTPAEALSDMGGLSSSTAASTYAPLSSPTFTGDITNTSGHLYMTPSSDSRFWIYVDKIITANSLNYGFYDQIRLNTTSNGIAANQVGVYGKTYFYQGANPVSSMIGLIGEVSMNNTDGGVLSSAFGVKSYVNNLSSGKGLISNAYGFYSDISTSTGDSITNAYGLYLNTPFGAGTIINKWGIYQADAGAKNYFAGNVTASSFIKSGSDAYHALMGDGSTVDLRTKVDTSYADTTDYIGALYAVDLTATHHEVHIDTVSTTKDGIVLAGYKTGDGKTFATLEGTNSWTGASNTFAHDIIVDNGTSAAHFTPYGISLNSTGNLVVENTNASGDLEVSTGNAIDINANYLTINAGTIHFQQTLSNAGTTDSLLAKSSGNNLVKVANNMRPYKVYTALVSNAGGDSSVLTVTVLENTLGSTVTWTRSGVGNWIGTSSPGAYTSGKTTAMVGSNNYIEPVAGQREYLQRENTSVIHFRIRDASNNYTDALVNGQMIEIRVYP